MALKAVPSTVWPTTIEEARAIQATLAKKVRTGPLKRRARHIAAMDASYAGGKVIAAACLFTWPELEHVEDAFSIMDCVFPYVPGYLSFREGPALEEAIRRLAVVPDLLLFDGQGIAHPRGMGIATHMGVVMGLPSVGCAKSRLVGEYREPGGKKGSWSPLWLPGTGRRGEKAALSPIGAVLRTREGVKPVFVSPGHLVDIEGAVRIVLACTGRYRLPEPLRHAHEASKKGKKLL
jgi:deoxyribonuclease V